jgi:small subunit ribosomal protein S18
VRDMAREDNKEGGRRRMSRERSTVVKPRRNLDGITTIDNRDYELLGRFVTDYGKILPARLTGATPKQQRRIKRAVRRARNIGVMA